MTVGSFSKLSQDAGNNRKSKPSLLRNRASTDLNLLRVKIGSQKTFDVIDEEPSDLASPAAFHGSSANDSFFGLINSARYTREPSLRLNLYDETSRPALANLQNNLSQTPSLKSSDDLFKLSSPSHKLKAKWVKPLSHGLLVVEQKIDERDSSEEESVTMSKLSVSQVSKSDLV
jgi:hypothetical protein